MMEETGTTNTGTGPQPVTEGAAHTQVKIVGVRFKQAGRVYYFDPSGIDLKVKEYVVVNTARGPKVGEVIIAPEQVITSNVAGPLKPVMRKAEEEDIRRTKELAAKEIEALNESSKLVTKLNVPMKLLSAEYSLDGSHLTIFFKAADRVDFRELVRELIGRLKVRVELRQVGPRDEAKLVGGYGRCGRELCCASYLGDFAPVSIKMAKEQNLPLNPMKIAGSCGRLLCCLAYESELKLKPKGAPAAETAVGEIPVPEEKIEDLNDGTESDVDEIAGSGG
jgi:cell fate regulator YaaT (PSP1 superfamily)